jgi:hypothetical protein
MEEMKKTVVNLTHESRYLGRDSNGVRPRRNYTALPLYNLHDVLFLFVVLVVVMRNRDGCSQSSASG